MCCKVLEYTASKERNDYLSQEVIVIMYFLSVFLPVFFHNYSNNNEYR